MDPEAGVTCFGSSLGGVVWEVMRQTYRAVQLSGASFASDTLCPPGILNRSDAPTPALFRVAPALRRYGLVVQRDGVCEPDEAARRSAKHDAYLLPPEAGPSAHDLSGG